MPTLCPRVLEVLDVLEVLEVLIVSILLYVSNTITWCHDNMIEKVPETYRV